MAITLLHASDLQFGKPFLPEVGAAFVAFARELEPDLVVVAGDLTQRAKVREYQGVRALLDPLPPVPLVVTPGNHDVPLYRAWERLFEPYRNWKRFMGPALDTVTRVDGAVVVSLNSSAPRRAVVAGRLDPHQVDFARTRFGEASPGDARILVTHHHFVPTTDHQGGRVLPRARALLAEFESMGVDLILGGHVHQTHQYTSRVLVPGEEPGIAIVACGTTASRRGRGVEAGHNTLNVVRVGDDVIQVVTHGFVRESRAFVVRSTTEFPRRNRTVPSSGGTS